MSKLELASRVPDQYNRATFADIIRSITGQVNPLSEGRLSARYNAQTTVPTGTAVSHAVGDFIPDSNSTITAGNVRLGWICTVAGTPGTLKEVWALNDTARLQSKIVSFTRAPGAAGGDVSYTGVGFKPTCLMAFGAQGASTNTGLNAIADSELGAAALFGDGSAPTFTSTAFVTVGVSTDNQSSVVKSYDADGFTLTWTKTGTPGGGDYSISVLCLR